MILKFSRNGDNRGLFRRITPTSAINFLTTGAALQAVASTRCARTWSAGPAFRPDSVFSPKLSFSASITQILLSGEVGISASTSRSTWLVLESRDFACESSGQDFLGVGAGLRNLEMSLHRRKVRLRLTQRMENRIFSPRHNVQVRIAISKRAIEKMKVIKKVTSFICGVAGMGLGGGIYVHWRNGEFGTGGLVSGLVIGALLAAIGFSGAFFTDWTKRE